jgi:hypothetical protein
MNRPKIISRYYPFKALHMPLKGQWDKESSRAVIYYPQGFIQLLHHMCSITEQKRKFDLWQFFVISHVWIGILSFLCYG